MEAFALSCAVVFLAELGDKSQLMAMAFSTRYRVRVVLVAITLATALVHLLSVGLGVVLGVGLPTRWVGLVAGLSFLAFGLWTLRPDSLSEVERQKADAGTGSALAIVFGAFFLAELGDKTMVATVLLAIDHGWFGTWLGSTVGMVAADALAIGAGAVLGRTLPSGVIREGAGILFLVGGLWMVGEALVMQ